MAASPAAAERIGVSDPFYFLNRHGAYAALSLLLILAASSLSPLGARRLAVGAFGLGLLLLALTPLIGHEVNGARRWLRIGGFSLQPVEFVKPALIVTAAWLFARTRRLGRVEPAMLAVALCALTLALLLIQPDVGQTALLLAAFGATAFVAGVSWRWLAVLGLAGAATAAAAYAFLPHVASRVNRFLDPAAGDTYQIDRAREAIAHGGLFGVGPGEGAVKRQLPDAHTDYIFAVAAEEYGLVFALAIIALFALFVARLLTRARRLADDTSRFAAAGLAALIGLQATINIAMALNLTPPKGMTLPLVSYGGSSLLAMGLAGGLALAFTRRRAGAFVSNG